MTETQSKIRHLGYARVSTYGQTPEAQLAQLKAQGCSKIYREKASGAQPDRRELLRLLKAIAPLDVVIVTRIDRLARSTFDLFAIVKQIVVSDAATGPLRFALGYKLHSSFPSGDGIAASAPLAEQGL
jgi:predicted site-specific integrase-resolvase